MKKKSGVPPLQGGDKVNRQRWEKRGLPPEKIKSRHFEKFIDCMVLKLNVYIINFINFISLFNKI